MLKQIKTFLSLARREIQYTGNPALTGHVLPSRGKCKGTVTAVLTPNPPPTHTHPTQCPENWTPLWCQALGRAWGSGGRRWGGGGRLVPS